MMSGMMNCAIGGAWLMGAAVILILLLLVIGVIGLLWSSGRSSLRSGSIKQEDR